MPRLPRLLAILGFLITTLLTMGCDEESQPRISVESRELGEFGAIDLNGLAELTVQVGQPSALTLEGATDAVKQVEAEVRDGVLHLHSKGNHWNWFSRGKNVRISVSTLKLNAIESNGAGSVSISGLDGGEHRVVIRGAHDVKASGKLDHLEITLNGAGNVDYNEVVSQTVKVNVNGAGNVEVQAIQTLDAQVNGVGAIRYRGEPQKVNSAIHGLGAIERK